MRKEVLFAVIAGVIFGIIVAFGIWRANSALKSATTTSTSTGITPTPSVKTPQEFNLAIVKPENDDVVTESPFITSGVTSANSWVVISGEEEDYIIQANEEGSFSSEINLVGGINNITFVAFDENGKSLEKKVRVVFSSEFAKDIATTSEATESAKETSTQEISTEESQAVREKVKQKVELARKNPKAFLGTITDKTPSTLQIKTEGGEIQQISIDDSTSYVKLGKIVSKVSIKDLAIGDFIIAMGFQESVGVLTAKRILLTTAPEPAEKQILMGKVTSLKKTELTVNNETDGNESKLITGKNLLVTLINEGKTIKSNFSKISEGDKIIVVAIAETNGYSARRIQIISSVPTPSPSITPTPNG